MVKTMRGLQLEAIFYETKQATDAAAGLVREIFALSSGVETLRKVAIGSVARDTVSE